MNGIDFLSPDPGRVTGSTNEFAIEKKMPMDGSLEKLRKEFNQQNKELGIESMSEMHGTFRSPDDRFRSSK